jgi:hypothetical protein
VPARTRVVGGKDKSLNWSGPEIIIAVSGGLGTKGREGLDGDTQLK